MSRSTAPTPSRPAQKPSRSNRVTWHWQSCNEAVDTCQRLGLAEPPELLPSHAGVLAHLLQQSAGPAEDADGTCPFLLPCVRVVMCCPATFCAVLSCAVQVHKQGVLLEGAQDLSPHGHFQAVPGNSGLAAADIRPVLQRTQHRFHAVTLQKLQACNACTNSGPQTKPLTTTGLQPGSWGQV